MAMATAIIKDKRITRADWQRLTLAEIEENGLPASGKVMVPLAYWKAHRDELRIRVDGACVWLDAGEETAEIAEDIHLLDTIGLHFPHHKDGRSYSYARELRLRYGYKGDIVAFGDVLRDQMFYMQRVGFNVFEPRADRDIEVALEGLSDFTLAYQGDVHEPRPIWRRWNEIHSRFDRKPETPEAVGELKSA
jgi:uncharacterized protein (DUF934 family)